MEEEKENKNNQKSNDLYLEEINVDINSILSFAVNIDNLKLFLSTLINNESVLSKRISKIEKKLNMTVYEQKKISKKNIKE